MSNQGPVPDSLALRHRAGAAAGSEAEERAEAGEPACWAHLVCPECGAVTSEPHRPGCGLAPEAAPTG